MRLFFLLVALLAGLHFECRAIDKEEISAPYLIIDLTKENFKEILKAGRPIVIDFYTSWCGYCKPMHRVIEEVNLEFGDFYQFCKLNAEKEGLLSTAFGVKRFPTIVFIKDGEEAGRINGYVDKETLVHKMQKFFQEKEL